MQEGVDSLALSSMHCAADRATTQRKRFGESATREPQALSWARLLFELFAPLQEAYPR